MRQAIQTKFFGPSNVRGSRVKAVAEAGSITLAWNHRLNIEANHSAAAEALAVKLKWIGTWSGGALPGSGYAFVLSPDRSVDSFTVETDYAAEAAKAYA